jgi:hypothetical protein
VQELVEAWARMMSGREIDAIGFAQMLVGAAAREGPIGLRVLGDSELELSVGRQSQIIDVDAARTRFRFVCARLAVVFGRVLYRGSLTRENMVLEFVNAPDGWLSITRI